MIVLGLDLKEVPRRIAVKLRKELKPIMWDIGHDWHKHVLPRHFRPDARHRYDYEPRDPQYIEDKKLKRRSTADNVFSRRSDRYSKYGERITSTAQQVTIRFQKPPHRPELMNDELTRVNENERWLMQDALLRKSQIALSRILREGTQP